MFDEVTVISSSSRQPHCCNAERQTLDNTHRVLVAACLRPADTRGHGVGTILELDCGRSVFPAGPGARRFTCICTANWMAAWTCERCCKKKGAPCRACGPHSACCFPISLTPVSACAQVSFIALFSHLDSHLIITLFCQMGWGEVAPGGSILVQGWTSPTPKSSSRRKGCAICTP